MPNLRGERGTLKSDTSEPMTIDTRIAQLLAGELVLAFRANGPHTFKRWLLGGLQNLGEPKVAELLVDWLNPFLRVEDRTG